MVRYMRDFLRVWLLLAVASVTGCSCGQGQLNLHPSSTSSTGSGGSDAGQCGVDCSAIPTPACTVAVCNTGQVEGTLGACVVVPLTDGAPCDDGKFCTTNDVCQSGACVGGAQFNCGIPPAPCSTVLCYEETQTCTSTPSAEGSACTPADLCQENGLCQVGECVGQPKDCSFSPLNECNTTACDSTTGQCVGTPDMTKDGNPCVLTGDLCSTNKTCVTGQCGGGTPKDCSTLDVGCQVGTCDSTTGICNAQSAPVGTSCTAGIAACHLGACTSEGGCTDSGASPDGVACNDHDACTQMKTCMSGACATTPITGCTLYFQEGFETCPDGWTLGGDWQCGTPAKTSPVTPHTGHGVLATSLSGLYDNNESFSTCTADSPVIDLTTATSPQLSFWRWDYTEGGTYDGWNLNVSVDNGPFAEVITVTPKYSLTIGGEAAWGGNYSAQGWQNFFADLSTYAGHKIALRFAFQSDNATVYPGVYLDDLVVGEPDQIPLYITTTSPLPDLYVGQSFAQQISAVGGTSNASWTITGGANKSWLTIDSTGLLHGIPLAANVGPVSVTVQIAEPSLPSNFDEQTFVFNVLPDAYYTGFEQCPNGWTLVGDWQCGAPMNLAEPTLSAYTGTNCIGTGMKLDYSNNDSFGVTTATSPPISLAGTTNPLLTFYMWVDTEGGGFDGANLQISTDGGTTWMVVGNSLPPYNQTIGGEGAWGDQEPGLKWQLVSVDLTAYMTSTINLRFAFQSDGSGTFPGVFIDEILIH
jgi:hypothetical protein